MNKTENTMIWIVFLLFWIIGISQYILFSKQINIVNQKIDNLYVITEQQECVINNFHPDSTFNKEWFLFKLALIKVESNFDFNAVNKSSGALGPYQFMPIGKKGFLDEVNRITVDTIIYTDTCALDPLLATEVFELHNQYHNPNKDIQRAIYLHNPGAGQWYKNLIMKEYDLLLKLSTQID